jgi:hypothetical protein
MYELRVLKRDGSQSEPFLDEDQTSINYYQETVMEVGDLAIVTYGIVNSFGEYVKTDLLDMWRKEESTHT